MNMYMKNIHKFILINIILLLPITSYAENIFLLTTTIANNKKTVRIGGETFYFNGTEITHNSSFQVIPGKKIIDLLTLNNNDNTLAEIFTSSFSETNISSQDDGIYYTLIDTSGRIKDIRFFMLEPGWEIIKISPYIEPTINLRQFAIFQKKEEENLSLGRVSLFALEDNNFLQKPNTEIPIPFAPDMIYPFGEKGMWVAVKSDLFAPPQLCIVDVYLKISRPFFSDLLQKECSVQEIGPVQDSFLLVMANCWKENASQGSATEIFVVDTKNGTTVTDPMPLFGEGNSKEKDIYPSGDGFWIKTTSISEGFGYLTFATWEPSGGWEKKWEYSFSSIEKPWTITVHPSQTIVAVAYNNRLEIVGEPFKTSWIKKFDEPITYMDWYSDSLLIVGIGGRLVQVNIKNREIKEWFHTNTGFVSNLFHKPQNNSSYPSVEFPNTMTVDELQFQSNRAGKEVQGLWLGKQYPAIIHWDISYINNPVEWLLWYQNTHFENTYLYLGLIPYPWGKYIPSVWLHVNPIINQELTDNDSPLPTSRYVRVHITKNRTDPRRILFIWAQPTPTSFRSENDPREIKLLVDILSGAPLYFSCEEISEPIGDTTLPDYGIVVVEAKAIVNGTISIKAMLDYVLNGGKLILLGDYWPEGDPELFNYWLTPLGVFYNPKQRFDGNLPIEINNIADGNNKNISIIGGGTLKLISETNTMNTLTKDTPPLTTKQLACLSRNYGYGKIVILSARTPLTSKKLLENENKNFAMKLFQGLTLSESILPDTDGDGLFDTLEDRNNNGIIDEGETNPFMKDSDGDGIPDGDEDQNRNGLWDENETDPTCTDSDGDGIWDGADISPIPAHGKQIITQMDPAEDYAEGGSVVIVQGRNFTNETQFIFGMHFSPFVRILSPNIALVVVPEYHQDKGGKVSVYPIEGKNKIKTEPGKPFLYKPRNKVIISITDLVQTEAEVITNKSTKKIQIIPSEKASRLKRVNFLLQIKGGDFPEIKMNDDKWNVKITHIKDNWYLTVAEWKKSGFAYAPFTFEITSSPEIAKIWAETIYYGRLTVETKYNP